METIKFTKVKLPFGWMGNMSPYPIKFEGKEWRTTEALFQAMRFAAPEPQEMIRAEKSPMGAKMRSKALKKICTMLIEPLSKEDVANMETCVRLKIDQHPELKKMLIETGDSPIYEDVTARGSRGTNLFWGAMLVDDQWVGQNTLGKIWEKVRTELKQKS